MMLICLFQTTYRSLARIFLPSIFQSYYHSPSPSSKIFWRKWKKEKINAIQQESERLLLEQCLMSMIVQVDVLGRVGEEKKKSNQSHPFNLIFVQIPHTLTNDLQLPSPKDIKRLNDLVCAECHGEFDLQKYTAKKTEAFLQVEEREMDFVLFRQEKGKESFRFTAFIQHEI